MNNELDYRCIIDVDVDVHTIHPPRYCSSIAVLSAASEALQVTHRSRLLLMYI